MFGRKLLQQAAFCWGLCHSCGCTAPAAELPPMENVLRQLEDPAGAAMPPAQFQDMQTLRDTLGRIIHERNDIARRNGGFFPLLMKSRGEYAAFHDADARLGQARVTLNVATTKMAEQQRLWATTNKEPLGFAGAQAFLNQARANLRTAEADWQAAFEALSKHIAMVRDHGMALFRQYTSLRSTLPHRRNAANDTIAAVIAEWREQSPDFVEGDVVAAIALAYSGKDEAATERLEHAGKIFERYPPLYDTVLAEDCCAAWLLLGRVDKVGTFVAAIDRMRFDQRTAAQQWLSAAYTAMRERPARAIKKYDMAIKKAKANAPPALRAEAAIAVLDGSDGQQALRKAKDYLERLTDETQWTVLRAKATLAAAEGEWEKAAGLMDQAKPLAPVCMEDELEQQREAYKKGESWSAKDSR